jgi:hypothetical protein
MGEVYAAKVATLPKRSPGPQRGDQRWSTFVKNHAKAIVACDFFVAVTATFRMLFVSVVIEHRTRRLGHVNSGRVARPLLTQLTASTDHSRPSTKTPPSSMDRQND